MSRPASDSTSAANAAEASEPRSRWPRWLGGSTPNGGAFESQRYLLKWLFLSTIIGIVAGLGAIAFTIAIEWVTHASLGDIAHYLPPSPVGEGNVPVMPIGRPWLLPLVTAFGGLLSGLIVYSLAPEAEGHGTDAAIDAIHHKVGLIRARIAPVKLLASAITIGTGGSAGREGPTAQISAAFGSVLAQWIGLSARDRRIAVAVGMGAGIGSIFRAPLGGAVMAAEILYIHDIEVEALIPSLIAAIVGYSVYGTMYGYVPIFGDQGDIVGFTHPIQLLYFAALGGICGLGGILYQRSFYGLSAAFHRLRWPRWIKPAFAGFLVGLLGLLLPGALHTGYGWVQLSMTQQLMTLPLWVVLLLPFAKILATSLSIGSGGSGGVFGPGMVIGGMLGASFWRLAHDVLPKMPLDPAPFVIIGMMALFGGIAHVPLAMMLMVAEMTGNLSLLAPAMVAVAIATALVGDRTIYRSQLATRADAPAHRIRFSFPLLSSLLVRDAMTPLAPGTAAKDGASVEPDQSLDLALDKLAEAGSSEAVVMQGGEAVGRLQVRDVMRTYKANLERSVRRARSLSPDSTLFEARLDAASRLAGRSLLEASLPRDTLVVSITREGETIFPRASTRLEAGDVVLIMADRRSEPALRTFLQGEPETTA